MGGIKADRPTGDFWPLGSLLEQPVALSLGLQCEQRLALVALLLGSIPHAGAVQGPLEEALVLEQPVEPGSYLQESNEYASGGGSQAQGLEGLRITQAGCWGTLHHEGTGGPLSRLGGTLEPATQSATGTGIPLSRAACPEGGRPFAKPAKPPKGRPQFFHRPTKGPASCQLGDLGMPPALPGTTSCAYAQAGQAYMGTSEGFITPTPLAPVARLGDATGNQYMMV